MMKPFAEALKIFLDKHFTPTIIAIGLTLLIYLITPIDSYFITKLGFWPFLILAFVITFLLVQLIIYIYRVIKRKINAQINKIAQSEQVEKDNKAALETLWSYVDGLSYDDLLLLKDFLKSDNQPIERNVNTYFSGDCLLNSKLVHSTIVQPQKKVIESEPNTENGIYIPITTFTEGKKQYVLVDNVYQILKYSNDKYGRISHFK